MSRNKGDHFEQLAQMYLKQAGAKILELNFNSRFGEIDLIIKDSDTLAFVEVRYRKNDSFGGAIASVTRTKQLKLIKTAQYYLAMNANYDKMASRFDVVAINNNMDIEWIKSAFIIP